MLPFPVANLSQQLVYVDEENLFIVNFVDSLSYQLEILGDEVSDDTKEDNTACVVKVQNWL